jgi:hypothetical protein
MTDSIQTEEVLSSFVGFGVCLLAVRLCFRFCVFPASRKRRRFSLGDLWTLDRSYYTESLFETYLLNTSWIPTIIGDMPRF